MANQYDKQSKDSVIDDARKTDQQSVAISRSRTKSIRNYKRARCNLREPSRIPYKKTLSLFLKGKVIKGPSLKGPNLNYQKLAVASTA